MKVQHSDTFKHNQSKNYERRSPISMQAAGGCTCRPGAGGGRLSFISFTPGGRSLRYQGWRWMSSTVNLLAQGPPTQSDTQPGRPGTALDVVHPVPARRGHDIKSGPRPPQ